MQRYRIGRIEGVWTNFLPPIQGGQFRRLEDGDDNQVDGLHDKVLAAKDATKDCPSSDSESRSPSPMFDSDSETHRRGLLRSRPSSTGSLSSASEEMAQDGMGHLDILTKKEISLDLDRYPSLDQATQQHIIQKYRALGEKIEAEGLYNCNYGAYAIEGARYATLFALSMVFLQWRWYALSAFFLGCFWHQLTFTAHDAGHLAITHDYQTDTVIGIVFADFLGGLSLGWWKRSHNVHHIVTNSPEHDPDIAHLPVFAISHRFLQSVKSSYYNRVLKYDAVSKTLLLVQHKTYYFLLLFGRFNLYRLSWEHLLLGPRPKKGAAAWHPWLELVGQLFYWYWYGYLILYRGVETGRDRLVYVLISHIAVSPVHLQIVLSHFAMSTADLGVEESFAQKMLRTTMDVECPEWLDFIHGGLQFQAVHHLFPRIPRHNLRKTQRLVQEFCAEVGIPYALYGFVQGNERVIGKLADVARQVVILAKCQKYLAEGGDHH